MATKKIQQATKSVVAVKKTVSAKKTVAKQAPKKAVAKKKTQCACKNVCEPAYAFWVNNGPVVSSLEELANALHGMSDEQFQHHTKRGVNDFANWIKDCLHDSTCAQDFRKVKSREGALRVPSKRCTSCN